MSHLFMSLLRKIGIRPILMIGLAVVVFSSVNACLSLGVKGLRQETLWSVTILGLLLGWQIARTRLSARLSAALLSLIGASWLLLYMGRLAGPLSVFTWRYLVFYASGVQNTLSEGIVSQVAPVISAGIGLRVGLATIAGRILFWGGEMIAGRPGYDLVANSMVWSLLVYLSSTWAGWVLSRKNRTLAAFVPAGALMAGVMNFARLNAFFLIPFLAAVIFLLVAAGQLDREDQWENQAMDFTTEIRFDLVMMSTPVVILILVLAAFAPSLSVQKLVHFFERVAAPPREQAAEIGESLGVTRVGEGIFTGIEQTSRPGLPASHRIGPGPEPSDEVVMTVETGDLPAMPEEALYEDFPRYYWRAMTFDRYTGANWTNGNTIKTSYEPDEIVLAGDSRTPTGYRRVQQTVNLVGDLGGALYATGSLVAADQPYVVEWRYPPSSEDMVGSLIERGIYTATSLLADVREADLNAAGNDYPDWVIDHYLKLPESIPSRVIALALDLTSTKPTPYERAKAIEAYLRTFPYSLDIPEPPPGRDAADFFLFDLKQGSCDYYATSMVVLSRAAGLPARLVVGYANGYYDAMNARYIVTQGDAHSWVEVYFVDIGWVEFEPTGNRPEFMRTGEPAIPQVSTPVEEPTQTITQRTLLDAILLTLAALGVLALLALLSFQLYERWIMRRLSPAELIPWLYARFYGYASQLGLQIHRSDTPYEFAVSMGEALGILEMTGASRKMLPLAQVEIKEITDLYARAVYSPRVPGKTDRQQVLRIWNRLRWRLRLAVFLKQISSLRHFGR